MKRKSIIILSVVAGIIVLLLIIPVLFKGPITRQVKNEVNRSLNAAVDFSKVSVSILRNFPAITANLSDLTVVGKDQFRNDTLAYVKQLSVSFNLIDILKGNYVINRVRMDRPNVLLKVLPDGSANWDIVKYDETTETEPVSGEEVIVLDLNEVDVHNGFLIYQDASLDFYLTLDSLDGKISGKISEQISDLNIAVHVSSIYADYEKISYLSGAETSFNGTVIVDLDNYTYRFTENRLVINGLELKLDGTVALPGDHQYYDLTFAAPSDDMKQFLSLIPAIYSRDFNTVKTTGKFRFDGFVKGRYDDQTFPGFSINLSINDGSFQYDDLPSAVENIQLDATLSSQEGSLDNLVTDIRTLNFRILDNPFSVRLFLEKPLDDPFIDAFLTGIIDLSDIRKVYPLKKGEELSGKIVMDAAFKGRSSALDQGGFDAHGSLDVTDVMYKTPQLPREVSIQKASISFGSEEFDLKKFDVSFGQSSLSASGSLKNYLGYFFEDELVTGNLSMFSDYLNFNEILAYDLNTSDSVSSDSLSLSVFEVPANVSFIIATKIDRLTYTNMDVNDLTAKVSVNDKKITLDQLNADFYGSKLDLQGEYDTWDVSAPLINVWMKLQNLEIEKIYDHFFLARQYIPFARNTEGTLSMELNFASLLDQNMKLILGSLAGKGYLNSPGFTINEINSLQMLDKALNSGVFETLKSGPVAVSFQFVDGMLNVKPFDIKAGNVNMNVSGWTSFDSEIGYDLKMKIKKEAFGNQVNQVLDDLQSKYGFDRVQALQADHINISAFVGGTLSQPEIKLGSQEIVKNLTETVKEEIEEEAERQAENLKEEALEIIEKADQQADMILAEAQKQADAVMVSARQLADQTREEAEIQAKKIEDEGKKQGQIAALAAKKAADKVRQEADKQAKNIVAEAQKKSDQILSEAREKANKVKADADEKVRNL